jgi:acetolactate synthase-1/3 small subunit
LDYTSTKLVERELLLVKVSILGPEHLHEQMPTAKFDQSVDFADANIAHTSSSSEKVNTPNRSTGY